MKYVPIRYLQPNFPRLLCQLKNHEQEDCMELFQCQAPCMYKNIKIRETILMLLDKIIKLYWNQIYTKWMIFFFFFVAAVLQKNSSVANARMNIRGKKKGERFRIHGSIQDTKIYRKTSSLNWTNLQSGIISSSISFYLFDIIKIRLRLKGPH